jgi:pantetheine-phosphate adenylyltransferase
MRTAIYPGTFDPITLGHVDVIQKSLKLLIELLLLQQIRKIKITFFLLKRGLKLLKNVYFQI